MTDTLLKLLRGNSSIAFVVAIRAASIACIVTVVRISKVYRSFLVRYFFFCCFCL